VPGTAWRHLIGPTALSAAGFLVQALLPEATGAALPAVAGICGWLALAWAAARLCDVLLLRRAAPYPQLLADLLRVVLFAAAGVAILLVVFQRPAAGLVTTSSVVIAVAGFALRNIIADMFSGIALGVEHPYAIGDWIETGSNSPGRVIEITWRTTRILGRSGAVASVPNGLIAGNRLVDYGGVRARTRMALRVPLDPAVPVAQATGLLLAGALAAERSIRGLAPDVLFQEYADGAAIYLVRFMVTDFERETACRDAVGRAVLQTLQHAGLEIARARHALQVARPAVATAAARREALLQHAPLFHACDPAERADLAERMEERRYAAGDVLVRRDETGDSLYVLAEGVLEVRADDHGAVIDRLLPGDVFGEMSLLTGQPRSATVVAAVACVAFEIRRSHLETLLQRRPALAEGLAAIMAERQARNATRDRVLPDDAGVPSRQDLLDRLRAFFRLR
jgi:small-conductance mechanosensitive channel/CRP-like cAMP-binding protein